MAAGVSVAERLNRGSGGGLSDAVPFDDGASRRDVRVRGHLAERQHRRDAGVGALERGGPLVARAGAEHGREPLLQLRPALAVVLAGEVGVGEAQPGEQRGVELRFDRSDRDVPPVRAGVGVVERGGPVEQVDAPLVDPDLVREEAPEHLRQQARPVDHGRVDDLALPRALRLPQRREHADDQQHRAATEIPHQVQRRHRPLARPADGVQRAGQRDVVDVVASARGRAARPGPSRSSGRTPAAGCGRGSRQARRRAVR